MGGRRRAGVTLAENNNDNTKNNGLTDIYETPTDIKDREGCSGEREHGNNSVTCVRTGSDPPSRVGPGRMCDEPW